MTNATKDTAELCRLVTDIRAQDLTAPRIIPESSLIGLIALNMAFLRWKNSTSTAVAGVLCRMIHDASVYIEHKETVDAIESRIIADMQRTVTQDNWELEFKIGHATRLERTYRLQQIVDRIAIDEARRDYSMVCDGLAHLITLCALWLSLILDDQEME